MSNKNILAKENSFYSYLSLVRKTIELLSHKQRRIFLILIPASITLSFLDFIGVILLASLGTMAFKLIAGDEKPTRIELIINSMVDKDFNSTQLSVLFLSIAIVALISKTILNALFSLKLTRWLARIDARLSDLANKSLLVMDGEDVRKISPGNALNLVISSGTRLTSGAIQASINLIVDLVLIFVLGTLLFFANPITATLNLAILIVTGYVIRKFLNTKVYKMGDAVFALQSSINDSVVKSILAFKEIRIYGMQSDIRKEFVAAKFSLSWLSLKASFLNGLFRYFLEIAILFSAVFIFLAEFSISDLRRAITSLILFLAAGLRLIPAIQRVQSALLSIRLTKGMTKEYFLLTAGNDDLKLVPDYASRLKINFAPSIECRNLTVALRDNEPQLSILKDITLSIPAGTIIGVLGDSGSGKTTFLDSLAGLIKPNSGTINVSTQDAILSPAAVRLGYCTQQPYILNQSLLANLTTHEAPANIDEIKRLLNLLGLSDLLEKETWNLRKDALSGGEKLRISFIRSICTDSALTLFDEPTSALDDTNTNRVRQIISEFKFKRTQFIATHDSRLIDICDLVILLEKGSVKFFGETKNIASV